MMEAINRDKPKKLYIQVLEILKSRIESNEWPVGVQIPVEEGLCKIYGVSKATTRLAVLELVRQGYLIRRQGRGTFVCEKVVQEGPVMSTSFKTIMPENEPGLATRIIAQTVMMPVDDLAAKLNIPDDKHLIYIKRLSARGNEPVMIQESFLPRYLCPQLLRDEISESSLIDLLEEKYDFPITRIVEGFDVAELSQEESRHLGLPTTGMAALQLEQHFFSSDCQIMYMRSVLKPGGINVSIEFNKRV
jgi:GntR family transcriptional regulator